MRPDFDACGADFLNNSATKYSNYIYNGPVSGILKASRQALITTEGCKALCGDGIQYYAWKDAANTITTWVLPIIGLIVQAPWESNQAWMTILCLFRWMGSPIATLSYILWNIKVTGKCALMVDMSTRYNEYPPEDSDFSIMRDSLFILTVMNQYSLKPDLPPVASERLLRLALFSNILQMKGSSEKRDSIIARRTELARELRDGRKKGVIPVFISFLWFVFALGLSIELAFNDIGGNATAHNLAIGLLVGWLPVMIVACTVDRNSVSADSIMERLNSLIREVRETLLDESCLEGYMRATNRGPADFDWLDQITDPAVFGGRFFIKFGGQGREHFHYGVAHPILCGIETKFIAQAGRDWLRHGYAARSAMIVGSRNVNGLKMFDARMIWQVLSSLIIVGGTTFGAFIISWFTPTVGLGCRTGGYLIYICIALGLITIEMSVWFLTHTHTHTPRDILRRIGSRLERRLTNENTSPLHPGSHSHKLITYLHSSAFREVVKSFILRPVEAVNTFWLSYIIFAQTFGSYQTCECMASDWSTGGGFIDFETYADYAAHGVYVYWGAGTALSCIVMSAGLFYIVNEYCTQSHLSTEHYGRAMQGLRMTRWYKKHLRVLRYLPDRGLRAGKWIGAKLSAGKTKSVRRSLVWTYETPKRMSWTQFQLMRSKT